MNVDSRVKQKKPRRRFIDEDAAFVARRCEVCRKGANRFRPVRLRGALSQLRESVKAFLTGAAVARSIYRILGLKKILTSQKPSIS